MKKDDHEVLRACKDVQKNKIIIIIIIIIIHWRCLPRIFICWFGSRISGPLGSPEPYYAPWNEQRVFPWSLNEGRIASHVGFLLLVLRSLPRTGQVLYRWVLAPRFFLSRWCFFFSGLVVSEGCDPSKITFFPKFGRSVKYQNSA